MPIYAYRCTACGHAKDVLQKIADPVLTTCPACQAESFSKQVTAAGFQLKGSGWYVTDFRGGSGGTKTGDAAAGSGTATATDGGAPAAGAAESSGSAASGAAAADSGSPTATAASCGTSCACH